MFRPYQTDRLQRLSALPSVIVKATKRGEERGMFRLRCLDLRLNS